VEALSECYMVVQGPQNAVSKAATIVKRLQDLTSGAVAQPKAQACGCKLLSFTTLPVSLLSSEYTITVRTHEIYCLCRCIEH